MNEKLEYVPLVDIFADADFNCRGAITPYDVTDLANDIAERGLVQPVTIAVMSDEEQEKYGKKYRLIAGYRRYTAHRVLEETKIKCIVRDEVMDEVESRFINISENTQRKDLTILQEAKSLQRLFELGCGEVTISERLNKSRGWVQVRAMLLKLPEVVQKEVEAGYINQSGIRELYAVYRSAGEEACFSAARELKDAKLRGKQATVNPNATKKKSKRQRSKSELFMMINAILDSGFEPGLYTRCLSWSAGEISTDELLTDFRNKADKLGIIFIEPDLEECLSK